MYEIWAFRRRLRYENWQKLTILIPKLSTTTIAIGTIEKN